MQVWVSQNDSHMIIKDWRILAGSWELLSLPAQWKMTGIIMNYKNVPKIITQSQSRNPFSYEGKRGNQIFAGVNFSEKTSDSVFLRASRKETELPGNSAPF